MAEPAHILVFDSGVGALSIIAEIKAHIPQCSITYASDTAYFPYGDKAEPELIGRVDVVLKQLEAHCQPDIIVVACNSASTVALPKIRDHIHIPTVGAVPAIKPAAQVSQSRVIGLLATPGTVQRAYTRDLIQEFASDCQVIPVGSSELVKQAERKLRGEKIDENEIRQVVDSLFGQNKGHEIDTVVLACTHFPLIKAELIAAAPKDLQWIDSGEAIARRVAYWIDEKQLSLTGTPRYQSIFTGGSEMPPALRSNLQKTLPGPIESITVP